jgi:predicted RecB family nuclease
LDQHREQVLRQVLGAAGRPAGRPASPAGATQGATEAGHAPAPGAELSAGIGAGHPPVLLAPDLTTGTRSGSADLLVWAGDGYLPVIIRAHRTRDAGAGASCSTVQQPTRVRTDPTHRARRNRADRLALAHHYRQLQELGWASTRTRGGVIGRGSPTDGAGRADTIGGEDDSAVIVWLELGGAVDTSALADYDGRFADRLAVAAAAVAGGAPLALPSRIAECRRCPWWPRCSTELAATGDISLLLTGDDVAAARLAGVDTIAELAQLPRELLQALPLTVINPAQAQLRARAWQRGVPLVRVSARSSISRADVEIDVDAESYGEDGAYLWGAQLSGADVGMPAGYRAFVTWEQLPSPAQGAVFGSFFGYLMHVRAAAAARGLSFAVFCYAKAAEERWMLGLARRYAGLAGVPDAKTVADFCASAQWVDLMLEIKRQFVLPGSLRLKELAAAVGFSWRDPEAGGENSMAWYRAAVGIEGPPLGDQDASSNPMADRVIRYNEDDVLATLALRHWITEHLSDLPTVADLG